MREERIVMSYRPFCGDDLRALGNIRPHAMGILYRGRVHASVLLVGLSSTINTREGKLPNAAGACGSPTSCPASERSAIASGHAPKEDRRKADGVIELR